MLRKLLAAVFAATLMAGSAWAANVDMTDAVAVGTTPDANEAVATDSASATNNIIIVGAGSSNHLGVITGSNAGSGDAGAAASYVVDGAFTLQINNAKSLTLTGGDSITTASKVGGNATLVIGTGSAAAVLNIAQGGEMILAAGTVSDASGTDVAGGGAVAGILKGAVLKNAGEINVGPSAYGINSVATLLNRAALTFADGSAYEGTGTINLEGEILIGATVIADGTVTDGGASALTATGGVSGLGALFASTNLAATGTIKANLADGATLGADALALKDGVAGGIVTINGLGAHTIQNDINVDEAGLVIDANSNTGVVTMTGAINAATVTTNSTTGGGGVVNFKGAVTGNVAVGTASASFLGAGASLDGNLAIGDNEKVTIGGATADDVADITIKSGKTLTVSATSGAIDVKGAGSSLTLESGSRIITLNTSDIAVYDGAAINIDAGVLSGASPSTTNGLSTAAAGVDLKAGSELNISTATPVSFTGNVNVGAAADGSTINLNMGGGTITGGVNAIDAALNITGDVTVTAAVAAATSATKANTPVGFSVADNVTATFNGGVAVGAGDVVLGTDSNTTVSGGTLAITDGNLVTKAGAVAEFKGGVALTAGDVNVTGAGTTQTFGGANSADNFTVGAGATLATTGAGPVTFDIPGAGTANTGTFAINNGATLDLTNAGATIGNTKAFDKVNLNGDIIVGMNTGIANTLTVAGDEANVNGTALAFTSAFGLGVAGASDAAGATVDTNNTIADFTGVTGDVTGLALGQTVNVKNIYGDFTLKFSDAADAKAGAAKILYVDTTASRLDGSGDFDDRALAQTNLQNGWADYNAGAEIDYSLASAVYDAVVEGGNTDFGLSANVDGLDAEFGGQLAIDLLTDMANPDTANYTQGVGKSIFRQGNVSETLNAGVGEIRGVTSAIGTRNTQLRGQLAGAAGVSYEYANPTLLLNNDYANRIWAGYLGQWEKGDTRNGVEGYNYDSHGFIVGYDRLVGCNFAFGGAFAYSRGDYEDKAALTNSSKIDNYSFNGYATYSALNGVFASLFGGYTHQKNDIEASYRGGATGTLFKSSDYDSDYWNIGGQLGYDFQPVAGLVLTPSIGLQYINGKSESHVARAWNTPGFFDSYVDGATQEALLLPIEIAARYTIDFSNCSRLAIEGNIGYSYNFIDNNGAASMAIANVQNGSNNPVIIEGYDRDAGRHTFNAGAGLRYTYDRFDIGLKYDYYLQQDAHAHRLMGTVGLSF